MKEKYSNYREFVQEYASLTFPFKSVFDKSKILRSQLFCEFVKTNKKGDLKKFTRLFFTDKQISDGFDEVHRRIPVATGKANVMAGYVFDTDFEKRLSEIHDDFFNQLVENTLGSEFFVFDLSATPIVKTLKSISLEVDSLKKAVLKTSVGFDFNHLTKVFAFSIYEKADRLNPILKNSIINAIRDDNENIQIEIHDSVNKADLLETYGDLKRHFNYHLAEMYSDNISKFPSTDLDAIMSVSTKVKKTELLSIAEAAISDEKDLDFFYQFAAEQDDNFIFETIEYFLEGSRKGYWEPLLFLNLWYKQWEFFEAGWDKPFSTVETLQSLPLTPEQKHILFGFIIKFYGGYPIQKISRNAAVSLRLLEKVFLSFPFDSAEKIYCRNKYYDGSQNFIPVKNMEYTYNASDFQLLSADHDFDFYYNVKNIPRSELVFDTIEYFEEGPRRGTFEPLVFLNLLWEQSKYVNGNLYGKANSTLSTLKQLPISEEQKHILFGFILKWKGGGYPIEILDGDEKVFYRLLEKEFLGYNGDTPEKIFCSKEFYFSDKQLKGKDELNNNRAYPENVIKVREGAIGGLVDKRNPVFKEERLSEICDLLKMFFPEQQAELIEVLRTGIHREQKLCFQGQGKALLDFFKQLIKGQFLAVSTQRDFENWISAGFEYLHNGTKKAFTSKYASKIISGNERAAKGNRLIDVVTKDGRFEISQLALANRQRSLK